MNKGKDDKSKPKDAKSTPPAKPTSATSGSNPSKPQSASNPSPAQTSPPTTNKSKTTTTQPTKSQPAKVSGEANKLKTPTSSTPPPSTKKSLPSTSTSSPPPTSQNQKPSTSSPPVTKPPPPAAKPPPPQKDSSSQPPAKKSVPSTSQSPPSAPPPAASPSAKPHPTPPASSPPPRKNTGSEASSTRSSKPNSTGTESSSARPSKPKAVGTETTAGPSVQNAGGRKSSSGPTSKKSVPLTSSQPGASPTSTSVQKPTEPKSSSWSAAKKLVGSESTTKSSMQKPTAPESMGKTSTQKVATGLTTPPPALKRPTPTSTPSAPPPTSQQPTTTPSVVSHPLPASPAAHSPEHPSILHSNAHSTEHSSLIHPPSSHPLEMEPSHQLHVSDPAHSAMEHHPYEEERRGSSDSSASGVSIESGESHESEVVEEVSDAEIVGPSTSYDSNNDLAVIFETRLDHVQMFLIVLMILLSALVAVIQYVFLFLPVYLASRKYLTTTVLLPQTPASCIYQCWVPCLVGLLCVVIMYILVQYPKNIHWKKMGEWRWIPVLVLQLYLVSAFLHYTVQTEPVHKEIETLMRRRFRIDSLESLYFTQDYHECCGLNSAKDWDKFNDNTTLRSLWHGTLCQDNSSPTQFGSKKRTKAICSVPGSCLYRTKAMYLDGKLRHMRSIHRDSCIEMEANLAFAVIVVFVILLGLTVCVMGATYGYLYCVVRIADKKHVLIGPKLHMDSAFQ